VAAVAMRIVGVGMAVPDHPAVPPVPVTPRMADKGEARPEVPEPVVPEAVVMPETVMPEAMMPEAMVEAGMPEAAAVVPEAVPAAMEAHATAAAMEPHAAAATPAPAAAWAAAPGAELVIAGWLLLHDARSERLFGAGRTRIGCACRCQQRGGGKAREKFHTH
jgi:hypothetical protein